ncbi:cytochrome P450 315a1, mitochondrial [Condylostylus longicornis]|uniref:cytochrome P450 315a1, mitochondrial n=1 Tax=Condylostylus longicornis TaxID=2530218 RepID=UPI00244DDE4C|nr:cytochrome P450 315a1, mitochondrial [Condylostylus longicornis]
MITVKNSEKIYKKNLNILIKNDEKKFLPFENIPAAKGLPIFGTHLDFIAAGSAQHLHTYISKRHEQLGPIFREKLGSTQDAVFVASPNLMRTVFNYEGQYPTHPLPESWTIYNNKHNCRRGLFFMNGREWLQNRRIMNKFLLNGNCNWIDQHIHNSSRNLIDLWKKEYRRQKTSSSFLDLNNLEAQLYRWSIDVLTSIMFGISISNSSSEDLLNEIEIFSKNVNKIFESSSSLMNFPPKLAEILKLKIWTDFETNVTNVLEMGNKIIDKSVSEFGYGNGLLSKMIECKISKDDIKRIFVDLIIAAGDTTAYSTQWALYLLTKSRNIQKIARNEINSLKANEESQYIKGLIRETLRLYPVAPFIGRFLATDAIIGNYRIHKDTLVLLSLYTSGRDENSFPNALKVSPERWFRNPNGELKGVLHPTASIPFAMGIRSCIGKKIALNQMYSLISQIIPNFEILCLNDSDVDVILRMVAVPNQPIRLVIREI